MLSLLQKVESLKYVTNTDLAREISCATSTFTVGFCVFTYEFAWRTQKYEQTHWLHRQDCRLEKAK